MKQQKKKQKNGNALFGIIISTRKECQLLLKRLNKQSKPKGE